jgi:hypothetical protein
MRDLLTKVLTGSMIAGAALLVNDRKDEEEAMTPTTQPSQAAREAAADLLRRRGEHAVYCDGIARGDWDDGDAVQAFARFERDTEKRVRESVAERTVPVAWLHTLHMEGGQNYTRLLEDDGRDEDEPERTAFGLPGRDYSEEYTVTSEPLYRAARESLAGEANVERVAAANAGFDAGWNAAQSCSRHYNFLGGARAEKARAEMLEALATLERTTDAG